MTMCSLPLRLRAASQGGLKGIELRSTKDRLREATETAYERGVRGVPSVQIGDEVFWGDDRLEDAAALLGRTPPR